MSKSEIQLSLDSVPFTSKPKGSEIGEVSNRLGDSTVAVSTDELPEITKKIGEQGYSFCTATFTNGRRSKKNFLQQQLFALDFDNSDPKRRTATPDEVLNRCNSLGIPVTAMYDTFSSTKGNPRFRALFLNDAPIADKRLVADMSRMLGAIFPEADHCWKDCSRMYFGGKKIIYVNEDLTNTINVDLLIQAHDQYVYLSDKSGKHYREKINRFWKDNKPKVASCDAVEKTTGACSVSDQSDGCVKNGGEMPSPIILETNIGSGKIPPFYVITYQKTNQRTSTTSTAPSEPTSTRSSTARRTRYRSDLLKKLPYECQLFDEFINGVRKLTHKELFGLITNLYQVEGGRKLILDTCDRYSHFYTKGEWDRHLSYVKRERYKPTGCDRYCPYKDACTHRTNILLTVAPGFMEKVAGYCLGLRSREKVQAETERAIRKACDALDFRVYVINSMTAIGKTTIFIRIVSERSGEQFLIAEPTILMKHECYERLKAAGIEVMETPSLDELKDELSDEIWSKLSKKRNIGDETTPYIAELVRLGRCSKSDASVLKEYLKQKQKLKTFKGTVVTTHRYLASCSEAWLHSFDHVIIDEDILYKLIATNHIEVSMHKLKKIAAATSDADLRKKIKQLTRELENGSGYIKLDRTPYNDSKSPGVRSFNLKAFCEAEHFYVRRPKDEPNLKKEMVSFVVPLNLPKDLKLIVVSATANEEVYEQFFGAEHVKFKMCHRAPYEGTLRQYYGLSMSRSCLQNHPGIIPHLQERFGIPDSNVITYLAMEIGDLHFGNAEGSNMLEGEDILIVGSAYQPPFIYVLASAALGFEIGDTKMQNQWIEYNGYSSEYYAFDDEELRAVQFWMIESELEQAVGRARLLWHDCTVYLFSNFPVQQAEMIDGYTIYRDRTRRVAI